MHFLHNCGGCSDNQNQPDRLDNETSDPVAPLRLDRLFSCAGLPAGEPATNPLTEDERGKLRSTPSHCHYSQPFCQCGRFRILKTLMINIYTFQRVIIFHVNYIFPAI